MILVTLLATLTGCDTINTARCEASAERLSSLQSQRAVLKDLVDGDQISKKRFKTLDRLFAEEEFIETDKYKNRCTKEGQS